MDEWGVRRVASPGAELKKWRERRKLSLRALANRVNCDHSQLWKIEKGKVPLTDEMAKALDQALDAGTALIRACASAHGTIRPAQLPVVPAQVVGRDAEVAALTDSVRDRPAGGPSVVAIDGPAGAGKTALALRWAHQVADQYVDGQLYADLGGFAPPGKSVSADVVLEGFLTAMGASSIPDTSAERAGLYRSMLAERHVLVVLDNIGDLDDVAQLMPASACCGVVVTSRRALSGLTRVGATRVTVRPLAEPDAISLVRHVIGAARAAAETEAVATLTRLCGQLPLALCVAAEHVAMYPHRRVVDLVDELLEADHRLSAWAITDLRAVFSWSYHDLGLDAARLFRLLGLHRGPHLSVAAAAALAGLTVPDARRLLHPLASLHLVDIDSDDVIRLHDLIRAYARDLVATDEDDEQRSAAIQRLVSWYMGTARAASVHVAPLPEPTYAPSSAAGVEPLVFIDDSEARAWRDTELDNFGPITTLALEYGPSGSAHHLATSLGELGVLSGGGGEVGTQDAPPTTPDCTSQQEPPQDEHDDHRSEQNGFDDRFEDGLDDRFDDDDATIPRFHDRARHGPPWGSSWAPPWAGDADGPGWGQCRFGGPWSGHGFGDIVHRAAQAILDDLGASEPEVTDPECPGTWWTQPEDSGPAVPTPRAEPDPTEGGRVRLTDPGQITGGR